MMKIPLNEFHEESFIHNDMLTARFDMEKKQYTVYLTGAEIESGWLENVRLEIANWSDLKVFHQLGDQVDALHIDAVILPGDIMFFELTEKKLQLKNIGAGWDIWVFSNPSVTLYAEEFEKC